MANLERGFRRLTWIISLVLAIPLIALGAFTFEKKDPTFAYFIILLGAGAFVFSWATFFILRWIMIGFRDTKPTHAATADSDLAEGDGTEGAQPQRWWHRLLGPFVRPFRFSYYSRPHCRHPCVYKDSWGAIHVICGAPPVDIIDVKGLEAVLERLKSGDRGMAEVLPGLFGAVMDESGAVPVCEAHRTHLWERIEEMFDRASEQEQEAFREWLRMRQQGP